LRLRNKAKCTKIKIGKRGVYLMNISLRVDIFKEGDAGEEYLFEVHFIHTDLIII
jgi:hypothetical protein